MKIWVDDLRPAPDGYLWLNSVNEVIETIKLSEYIYNSFHSPVKIEVIDLDHDAGDYARFGGDYIKILDWMEATDRSYPIRIHTANPVGRQNMMAIAEKNGWEVLK